MPIFEYKCEKCGHIFEVLELGGGEKKRECPQCGSTEIKKLLHPPTLVFKGPGFYATEYGKQKANKNTKSSNGSTTSEKKENASKSSSPTSSSNEKK